MEDLAVAKVFSENGGVLGFVKLCLKQIKTFKDEAIKSFELFSKIIKLYPNKVESLATNVVVVSRSSLIMHYFFGIFNFELTLIFEFNRFVYSTFARCKQLQERKTKRALSLKHWY